MKSKKISALFVLSLFLVACLPLVAMAETKTSEESPDAVILFRGGRGILIEIHDIREKPATDLNYSFWCNITYLIREPIHHYNSDTFPSGTLVGIILAPRSFIALGRFSVEVWAGNTYAEKTGLVIGRHVVPYL